MYRPVIISMRVAVVLALLLLPAVAGAAVDGESGWISLFDGQSLQGWKANERQEQWKVVDGCIIAQGERSHLFYVGADSEHPAQFKNFDFKAEVMTTPGSNSGVYFHTRDAHEAFPRIGYECQIQNTKKNALSTGSVCFRVNCLDSPVDDDKWFLLEISVEGRHVVTKVDGKVIVDYTEPEGDIKDSMKLSQGTFALQAHGPAGMVRFKNLRVRAK